jgi:hypothetical protein
MQQATVRDMPEECFHLRIGPFHARVETALRHLIDELRRFYPDPFFAQRPFADFHIRIRRAHGLRRWYRPQAIFELDGETPFKPLPLDQAVALFEWGMNHCIAGQAHHYLIVHAAVIERNGRAAILPAAPGSGKSTLTAALVHRGWRLLSDELTLLRIADRRLVPLARPVSLKNRSIDIIRGFAPEAVFGPRIDDTSKGTVALMRAPQASIERISEPAQPGWIVFPQWKAGSPASMTPVGKADALMELARNATNYHIHGADGFAALCESVDNSTCRRFVYGDLDDAVAAFAQLSDRA